MLEIRASGTLSATGKTLTGYAAVFNSEAVLGDFSEVIRQGAFAKSLATGSNIRALYQHQGDALLGTKVKAALFQINQIPDFDPTRVMVVTARGPRRRPTCAPA